MANIVDIQLKVKKTGTGLKQTNKEVSALDKNVQKLDKNIKEADESVENFGKSSAGISELAVGVTAAVGALALMVTSTIRTNKELRQLATLAGMSVAEFQKFSFAASLAGATADQAADAINDLSLKINEAAILGGGAVVDVFNRLGISFQEIKDLKPQEQFEALIKAMEGISAQQRKLYLDEIASDALIQLTPLVNEYEKFIKLADEFEAKGGFVSEKDNLELIKLDQSLQTLNTQLSTTGSVITSELSEALSGAINKATESIQKLTGSADDFTDLRVEIERVIQIFNFLGNIVSSLANGFAVMSDIIAESVLFIAKGFENVSKSIMLSLETLPVEVEILFEKVLLKMSEFKDKAKNILGDVDGDITLDSIAAETARFIDEIDTDLTNFVFGTNLDYDTPKTSAALLKQEKLKEGILYKSEQTIKAEAEINRLEKEKLKILEGQKKERQDLANSQESNEINLNTESLKGRIKDVNDSLTGLGESFAKSFDPATSFVEKELKNLQKNINDLSFKDFANQSEADEYFKKLSEDVERFKKLLASSDSNVNSDLVSYLEKQLNAVQIQVVKTSKEINKAIKENPVDITKFFKLNDALTEVSKLENKQLVIKASFQAGKIDIAQFKSQTEANVKEQQKIYKAILDKQAITDTLTSRLNSGEINKEEFTEQLSSQGGISLDDAKLTEIKVKSLALDKSILDIEKQANEVKKQSINVDQEILNIELEILETKGLNAEANKKALDARIAEIKATKDLSKEEKDRLIKATESLADIKTASTDISNLVDEYNNLSKAIDETNADGNQAVLDRLQSIIDKVKELESAYGITAEASEGLTAKQVENSTDAEKAYQKQTESFAQASTDLAYTIITDTENAGAAFQAMLLQMVQASLKADLNSLFTDMFSSISSSGSSTGGGGGGFADIFGFISQFIGGIFHDGGVVGSSSTSLPGMKSNEELILAQQNETVRTEEQEKALQASMSNSGGSNTQPINITNLWDGDSVANALESSPAGENFVLNVLANNPDQVNSYANK